MVTTARGVQTAIEAMRSLPGVHLALVCVPSTQNWSVTQLRPLVTQGGLEDRVHFLEPVRPGQVVDFLRSADLGLLPFLHFPSHEMALANKMFEYVNAGLPVVVSDCRTQAEFVRSHRIGEVFAAGDPAGLARAVRPSSTTGPPTRRPSPTRPCASSTPGAARRRSSAASTARSCTARWSGRTGPPTAWSWICGRAPAAWRPRRRRPAPEAPRAAQARAAVSRAPSETSGTATSMVRPVDADSITASATATVAQPLLHRHDVGRPCRAPRRGTPRARPAAAPRLGIA